MTFVDREDYTRQAFYSAELHKIMSWRTSIKPGTTPIAPVYSKLRMANLRYAELRWLLWAYLIDDPYTVKCTSNAEGSRHNLTVEFKEEPDFLFWGNLLGEFAHNLRSAFDQLIFILSKAENGGKTPDGTTTPKDVKMPIFMMRNSSASNWNKGFFDVGRGGGQRCIRKILNPTVREAIEKAQPYHSETGDPKDHPLWIINELCNTDKHREVLPISLRPIFDYFFQRGGQPCGLVDWTWQPAHFCGQADRKIGSFISPAGSELSFENSIFLTPAIEAVTRNTTQSWRVLGPSTPSLPELGLPQHLLHFVLAFIEEVAGLMGWKEALVCRGMPTNPTETVLPRKWLPGRNTMKPFVPTMMDGRPMRFW